MQFTPRHDVAQVPQRPRVILATPIQPWITTHRLSATEIAAEKFVHLIESRPCGPSPTQRGRLPLRAR